MMHMLIYDYVVLEECLNSDSLRILQPASSSLELQIAMQQLAQCLYMQALIDEIISKTYDHMSQLSQRRLQKPFWI